MMNGLLDYVDNMPGPQFLLLYGVVIAVTLAACWAWRSFWQPRGDARLPPIPQQPDPYAIAYLRGGKDEVVRLAVFHLLQQGYLHPIGSHSHPEIMPAEDPPRDQPALQMERLVLGYFSHSRGAHQMYPALRSSVKRQCAEYHRQLEQDELVTPFPARLATIGGFLAGSLIILGLGGFKLFDALAEGRSNVGFLILMGLFSFTALIFISFRQGPTPLGRRYLQKVQLQFADLRDFDDEVAEGGPEIATAGMLAMGIFGAGVLAGTQYYNWKGVLMNPPTTHNPFTPGGGCGAGGCGGGGCGGGGCGGCGGG